MTLKSQPVGNVLQLARWGDVVIMRRADDPPTGPLQAWTAGEFAWLREAMLTGAAHPGVIQCGGWLVGMYRHVRAGDRLAFSYQEWAALQAAFRAGEYDRLTAVESVGATDTNPVEILALRGSERAA